MSNRMIETIAKPREHGRADCPQSAAARWGQRALPGLAITSMATVAVFGAALAAFAAESIPQAPVVTYGLVRDEFGYPLTAASDAEMALVRDDAPEGRVYARTAVGETAYPGVNYRLALEVDSTGPERAYAVVTGTKMRVTCTVGGEATPLTPGPTFTTPANGVAQRMDFAIGEDADGDGMPDVWEAWVLQVAGRAYDAAAIAAFRPDADADGDGMSNISEFYAGTDPFEGTDLLSILSIRVLSDRRRAEIRFTTSVERSYRLVAAEKLEGENTRWVPVKIAKTPDGALSSDPLTGDGRIATVYASSELAALFFRVAME